MLAFGLIGLYVVLVGLASFAEKPVAGRLDAFALTAALKVGTVVVAVLALIINREGHSLSMLSVGAGLGIGVINGTGAAFYCFSVQRLPLWFAAAFSNAYIAVTAALGIIVLHEPISVTAAAGLILTVVGIVVLSVRGRTSGASLHLQHIRLPVLLLLGYVVVVGIGTFLEKPALHSLASLQLNALVATGMVAVAAAALLIFDRSVPRGKPAIEGAGVGAAIGLGGAFYYLGLAHLPVSVAATLSNGYVLIPVILGVLVLHESLGRLRAAGIAITLLGVILLTVHV